MTPVAADGVAATLTYVSKDGDQNFPGTLTTRVTYTLTNDNTLRIDYVATTDKDTVITVTSPTVDGGVNPRKSGEH